MSESSKHQAINYFNQLSTNESISTSGADALEAMAAIPPRLLPPKPASSETSDVNTNAEETVSSVTGTGTAPSPPDGAAAVAAAAALGDTTADVEGTCSQASRSGRNGCL